VRARVGIGSAGSTSGEGRTASGAGRSSSGSTISGPQAGLSWSASSHPEEACHSESRTILAPGSARNLFQSPEGGRNRYFKIDFPPFSATVTQRRGKHVAEMPLQALRSPVWRFAFLVMFFALCRCIPMPHPIPSTAS